MLANVNQSMMEQGYQELMDIRERIEGYTSWNPLFAHLPQDLQQKIENAQKELEEVLDKLLQTGRV